jgi:phosphoribosylformylglycinamidine cyclo-ligase
VCTGAEPLFFLDHVVVERLVPDQVADLVAGVAEGCRRAGCALLGGETAEHPGHLAEGRFDLSGFCVGIVDQDRLLGPHRVAPGDALVGVRSSGLHANGYSLVRAAVAGMDLEGVPEGLRRPLVDELLEPTLIYVPAVLDLSARALIRSAAHITGGGLVGNVPRALPEGAGASLDRSAWIPQGVFGFLARTADVSEEDMYGIFNMGLGMVLVADPGAVPDAISAIADAGFEGVEVGRVTDRPGVVLG